MNKFKLVIFIKIFIIDNFIQTNVTSTASNIVIYVYCRHGVVRNIVDDTAAPKSCLTMVVVSDISIHDCSLIQQTGAGIMISNSWNVRIVNNYFETTAAAVSSYPIWVPDYNADIDGLSYRERGIGYSSTNDYG